MLIISYGIPKSGSTLAYELLRGMLANAGFAQEFARDGEATAAPPRRGARLSREKIEEARRGDRAPTGASPSRRMTISIRRCSAGSRMYS